MAHRVELEEPRHDEIELRAAVGEAVEHALELADEIVEIAAGSTRDDGRLAGLVADYRDTRVLIRRIRGVLRVEAAG